MANTNDWRNIIATTKNFLKIDDKGEGTYINERNLIETKDIIVPSKIDLYTGLDLTVKDKIFVKKNLSSSLLNIALLVNGENYVCAFLTLGEYEIDGERQILLTAAAEKYINFNHHQSTKYFFVFFEENFIKFRLRFSFDRPKLLQHIFALISVHQILLLVAFWTSIMSATFQI